MSTFLMNAVRGEKMTGLKRYAQAALAGMALTAGAAMAQTGDSIDTSSVVATITSGLAAIAAIGAAFLGFKYLKKVWNRL